MHIPTMRLVPCLLLSIAAPAFAQEAPAPQATSPGVAELEAARAGQAAQERAKVLRSAQSLEVVGGVLTGVGLVTEIATVALWSSMHFCFDSCSRTPAQQRSDDQQYAAAVATAVLAPLLMTVGITTWAVGANRRKTLERGKRVQPTLTLTAGGLIGQF